MKIWNNEEVKSLFIEVEKCKDANIALRVAFKNHAQRFGRQTNSVRNYYYHEVDNLQVDETRQKTLGIELNKHKKNHFVCFDKENEESLIKEIEKLTGNGMSVRSACLKMSGGDLTLMTRIQNKYQNLKKKVEKTDDNNIILFRQKQKLLTENDINSLFLGLVKLIKKTAVEEYVEKNSVGKENILLKKAFLELNRKDRQIVSLRADFESLKEENKKLLAFAEMKNQSKKEALKRHLAKKKISKTIETENV